MIVVSCASDKARYVEQGEGRYKRTESPVPLELGFIGPKRLGEALGSQHSPELRGATIEPDLLWGRIP